MTVWAFLSDIHGNYAALGRAARWCEHHGVDRYVCLGDVIGRGDPEACVEWVRDHATIAIVGNRDLDYLDRVRPELQEIVRGWPNEARTSKFIVSHGDPKLHKRLSSSAVREDFRKAAAYMKEMGARLWLFGHTHNARVWRLSDDAPELLVGGSKAMVAGASPSALVGNGWGEAEMHLDPSSRYVVNVGTTGMPLPGRGGAAFATYDDDRRSLRIVSIDECRSASEEPPGALRT